MDKIVEEDLNKIISDIKPLENRISGKTFLVTGGSGFIGSWFCDVLTRMSANVICVDNLSSGHKNNIDHLIGKKNFTFVNSDVLDYEPKEKLDYIVHMASMASPPLYMEHPIQTLDSNVLGTRKLLELAKKNNVGGFLLTSTSEIYGDTPDHHIPIGEGFYGNVNSFGPRSMYDEGKRAAEAYCYSYFQKFKIPIRVARIFNTYGPRLDVNGTSQYGRALIKFVHQSVAGSPITVYGDGKQTRSFCYITDQIVGLMKLLLTPGIDGHAMNIGSDREVSIEDLAKIVVKISVSNSKIEYNSSPNYNLKDDPKRRCPNITVAKTHLNFSPKVSLEEGVKRTVEWVKGVSK